MGGGGPGVRLRRLADRAQERRRARRRVRGTRPGTPRVRGRRAAARRARGPRRACGSSAGSRTTQVPDWIAACDVLCQPSLREPFGQAALEAMAMERTVVATHVGGPPEFVTADAGRARRPPRPRGAGRRARARRGDAGAEPRRPRAPPPSTTSGARRRGWRRCSSAPSRARVKRRSPSYRTGYSKFTGVHDDGRRDDGEDRARGDDRRLRVHRRERDRARRGEEDEAARRRLAADLRRGRPAEGHAHRPRHRAQGARRGPRPGGDQGRRAGRRQAGDRRRRRLESTRR